MRSAEGEEKAAAMAEMEAREAGEEGGFWRARCFREKRARKRTGRGVDSSMREARRVEMVARVVASSSGEGRVMEAVILAVLVW